MIILNLRGFFYISKSYRLDSLFVKLFNLKNAHCVAESKWQVGTITVIGTNMMILFKICLTAPP